MSALISDEAEYSSGDGILQIPAAPTPKLQ